LRIKNKKLEDFLENTDRRKEHRLKNEFVERGIESDIKFFKA